MKKSVILFFATILSINAFAQISFKEGYFIDEAGSKTTCLIKSLDWKNNPTEFEYKTSEDGEILVQTINTVSEFGIDNFSKYIKAEVEIDKSSEHATHLSNKMEPIFEQDTLFLKLIVEGKANLYAYVQHNLAKYFYNNDEGKIEQLVYKSYIKNVNEIRENVSFRSQLWNNLKCETFKVNRVSKIAYKQSKLKEFFVAYNECHNEEYISYEEKGKRDLFNVRLRPGINFPSLAVNHGLFEELNADFGSMLAFRFGIEFESVMPYFNNKWALLVEPTYQYFKAEDTFGSGLVKAEYKSIEIPFGLRYYLFLNEKSQVFVNASYILDANFNSTIDYEQGGDLKVRTKTNFGLGVGYRLKDVFNFEIRYQTPREIARDYAFFSTNYQSLSLIFGYAIF